MMDIKDVLQEGSDYKISLSKLTGKNIIDAVGYVSQEFGFPVFRVTDLVFDDGSLVDLEGEHDIAYISQGRDMPSNMDEETLRSLI